MSKNFLLSKISVLTLMAVMLNALTAPAWSMENGEEDKNPSSITFKNTQKEEEIRKKFCNGKLIYKLNAGNDVGMIELPISSLADPLNSKFDLSQCGKAGDHIRIATGFRKQQHIENYIGPQLEVFLAPKYVIARNLTTSAGHFQPCMEKWNTEGDELGNAPISICTTWGGSTDLTTYDLTMYDLSTKKFRSINAGLTNQHIPTMTLGDIVDAQQYWGEAYSALHHFYVSFEN